MLGGGGGGVFCDAQNGKPKPAARTARDTITGFFRAETMRDVSMALLASWERGTWSKTGEAAEFFSFDDRVDTKVGRGVQVSCIRFLFASRLRKHQGHSAEKCSLQSTTVVRLYPLQATRSKSRSIQPKVGDT